MYLIDATDEHRLDEAREHLVTMVSHHSAVIRAVLILCTKMDLPGAPSLVHIISRLRVSALPSHVAYCVRGCTLVCEGSDYLHGLVQWAFDAALLLKGS